MDILKIIVTVLISATSGLIGILVGAWINNVFTWKIKNKIDALDDTYKDVLNLNSKFSDFIIDSNNNSAAIGYVNNEVIDRVSPKIAIHINNLDLYCFIIDGKRIGEFYSDIIAPWVNFITHIINGSNLANSQEVDRKFKKAHLQMFTKCNDQPSDIATEYDKLFGIVQESILSRRTEITSFCYMLKECNPLKIVCTN